MPGIGPGTVDVSVNKRGNDVYPEGDSILVKGQRHYKNTMNEWSIWYGRR